MKRTGVSVAILFSLVFFGLWGLLRTEHTIDSMEKKLAEIESAAQSGDEKELYSLCGSLSEEWADFRHLAVLMTDSEHALEITMSIARIGKAREDELVSECGVLRELLKTYRTEQKPTLLNIL